MIFQPCLLYQMHSCFSPSHTYTHVSDRSFMYIMCMSHMPQVPIRRLMPVTNVSSKYLSDNATNQQQTWIYLFSLHFPEIYFFLTQKHLFTIFNWTSKIKCSRGFIYATRGTMALPEWISMCCFRFWIRVNRTPHVGHWKGLSGPLGLGRSVLLVEGAM